MWSRERLLLSLCPWSYPCHGWRGLANAIRPRYNHFFPSTNGSRTARDRPEMNPPISVFLDFNLPNATTWFYFSWLLAIALFFKFSRVLSMRNWDVVMLFLLVPGLLLVQSARPSPTPTEKHPAVRIAGLVGHGAMGGIAG